MTRMKKVYRRCCGIDVHKDSVEVCVLPAVGESGVAKRKRFGTFRAELIQLRKWLKLSKVTEIAMESTCNKKKSPKKPVTHKDHLPQYQDGSETLHPTPE